MIPTLPSEAPASFFHTDEVTRWIPLFIFSILVGSACTTDVLAGQGCAGSCFEKIVLQVRCVCAVLMLNVLTWATLLHDTMQLMFIFFLMFSCLTFCRNSFCNSSVITPATTVTRKIRGFNPWAVGKLYFDFSVRSQPCAVPCTLAVCCVLNPCATKRLRASAWTISIFNSHHNILSM